MPSAWCHVVWEKTRQCISSSAPPWCTQRRPSLNRDASSSSTTPTVSSQASLWMLCSRQTNTDTSALSFLFAQLHPIVFSSSSFCFTVFILHPGSFPPPSLLSCCFSHTLSYNALVSLLTWSFLICSYQTSHLSPLLVPPYFLLHSVPLKMHRMPFNFSSLAFHSTLALSHLLFFPLFQPLSWLPRSTFSSASLKLCLYKLRLTLSLLPWT